MANLFDHDNYRKYIAASFEDKKALKGNYSFQMLANKAGFKDRGFIPAVIKGRKNLSKSSIYKISRALGHNSKEEAYFENLVGFNQAADLDERNHFHEKLRAIKNTGKGFSKPRQLRDNEFEYLSEWYHVVIRSLINQLGFKGDYAWLAKQTSPSITPKQAKKSVDLLLRLGLLKKTSGGQHIISEKHLTTGKDTLNLAALNFHSKMADLGKNAIHKLSRNERFLTGLTLGISRKSYDIICEKLQSFVAEAQEIAENDQSPDGVYQINFQMFPVSKKDINRRQ
jgi:uncharacterized protein (TIGR02147 family)